MPAISYNENDPRQPYRSLLTEEEDRRRRQLAAQTDVFAQEQQDKQDRLDALVDKLAAPTDLAQLESFLASDAEQQAKIQQLVNFLADDGPVHDELAAESDVFVDEQVQKQKALEELVDSLATNATQLLATDADDVDVVGAQPSFLNVVGGAVLLLVAVVLAVVSKRSGKKREQEEDPHKDFGYSILYE